MTLDGVRIILRANVDIPEEAEAAAKSGAEGVGLMRTEFLVVGRASMPDFFMHFIMAGLKSWHALSTETFCLRTILPFPSRTFAVPSLTCSPWNLPTEWRSHRRTLVGSPRPCALLGLA